MADVMTRPLALLALIMAVQAAVAEQLTDPTRPPPGLVKSADEPAAPPPPPLRVSSVFVMGERAYAIVDGQEVRIGDPLGEGRVSRIDEHGVWIRLGKGVKQLPLLPAIDKTPAKKGMEK